MIFNRYAKWVSSHPWQPLIFALLSMLIFGFFAKDVRLNNHFAELFALQNDANQYREFYREDFGADDGILLAIIQPEKVDVRFIEKLHQVTKTLESEEEFLRVLSPTNVTVIREEGDEVYVDPVFDEFDETSISWQLQALRESPSTKNRVLSEKSETFAIYAELSTNYDRFERIKHPADKFRSILETEFNEPGVRLDFAGIAFTRIGILNIMHQDLFFLTPLTVLVIGIITLFLFKDGIIGLITLLASFFGLVATAGVMGFNGDDINQLTITFPVLLMVIVVANSIHFYHRYFRELLSRETVQQAVEVTAEKIAKAAFLSCFTTAIGFYALITAEMEILKSFGFYLGTGVLMSYLGMILVIPSALLLLKPRNKNVRDFSGNDAIVAFVQSAINSPRREVIVGAGFCLLLACSYLGSKATYDYYLSDMLDDDHPQILAGDWLDEEMSGALPIEISVLGKEGDFHKASNLQKVLKIEQWLLDGDFATNPLSLASLLDALNVAIAGDSDFHVSDDGVAQLMLLLEGSPDDVVEQLVNDDFSHARIKVNMPDLGAHQLMIFQQDLHAYAEQVFKGTDIQVRLTGEVPVAYEGMNRLTEELIESVLAALLSIVITIVIVFRDWRLALGSIFPNLLPIILGLAFYAATGTGLNPLPGIAFCIAIGIAVDDTVHLFSRFNEELEEGFARNEAIIRAIREVKGALIISSVMLTAGFLIFLLSGFTWNRDLGLLGAFLIVAALIADLIFTPAVLSYQAKGESKV